MTLQTHKDLDAWKASKELAVEVYKLTKLLPVDERFGLVSQMNRAAVSIPSNIAEGAARANTGEFSQFVSIALGSLAELETQLMIAEEIGAITGTATVKVRELVERISRMLTSLRKALQARMREKEASRLTNHRSLDS